MRDGSGFRILSAGPEGALTFNGPRYRSWDGVQAIFGVLSGVTYLRFADGRNPNNEDITFAPKDEGTFSIDGASYVVLRGLTIRNAYSAVHLRSAASDNIVEGNFLQGGRFTVYVSEGAARNHIRRNEITLGYLYTLNPNDPLHWFVWYAFRENSDNPRVGVKLLYAGSDNQVYDNHVFEHFDGISDAASSTLVSEPLYGQRLKVYGNTLEYMGNDGLHAVGGEIDTEWHDNTVRYANIGIRISPSKGPLSVYRNTFYSPDSGSNENSCMYFFMGTVASMRIYHNSCATRVGVVFGATTPEVGLPGARIIDNVFSSAIAYTQYSSVWAASSTSKPVFDYNWLGGGSNYQSWMGGTNVSASSQRIWGTTSAPSSFTLPNSSSARGAGVDLNLTDGRMGSPYPGLPRPYFSGARPNIGAVQD
jgi:hypothetical protein